MQGDRQFHDELKHLLDEFVHFVYDLTEKLPKEEHFGVTSQLRRSTLSIILNYIEGFARRKKLVLKNFLEISYGSLKEVKYLLYFSYKRGYITKDEYEKSRLFSERIGKMLWGILIKI